MLGPWTDIVIETRDYIVYKDGFPVTEGHILFVPKSEDWDHLSKCYKAAYAWGYDWVQSGYCDASIRLKFHHNESTDQIKRILNALQTLSKNHGANPVVGSLF